MDFEHKPVLLTEVIDELEIKENGIYVDCTIGGAGHSQEIVKQLGPQGQLIGIDQDQAAIKAAGETLSEAQAKRYIKEAYKLFKEEALIELSESKAFHLKARIEQYKDLVAERDKIKQSKKLEAYKRIQMIAMLSNQINSILRDMAKIDGLFVHKVEHTGKDGSPIQFLIPSATEELGSDIIE